jgi:hypothetical protein
MNVTTLTPQQLRRAADFKETIDALQEQLNAILDGGETPTPVAPEEPGRPRNGRRKRRRRVSAEGRANISAAAKARWAARRLLKRGAASVTAEPGQPLEKPKRKRSAAWSKALSEAMKARWARARRAGKSSL